MNSILLFWVGYVGTVVLLMFEYVLCKNKMTATLFFKNGTKEKQVKCIVCGAAFAFLCNIVAVFIVYFCGDASPDAYLLLQVAYYALQLSYVPLLIEIQNGNKKSKIGVQVVLFFAAAVQIAASVVLGKTSFSNQPAFIASLILQIITTLWVTFYDFILYSCCEFNEYSVPTPNQGDFF